ncbi:hypothetical protein PGUG_03246 [Meyerozyma guilliermondii ATCC 6260]|uniref:NAD-dependent epimerase/dehydratase domain-containing protein n=1 Tax=Meyerozyma guilliermondii (strain ATCC 6260 / CBS 566 / DSM 6381 / JCM 1539 / NBRC 10279 / NRRL Y-324) TaxID=294746 RepID=A5DIZ5_PICGU|nr:uncharacterized protein PGUG_03246 [Meyerozyma guilliermondii ATCC 6260]EDK39148.2 hypothetical protein PGUG_03246 [Meyerozyma guilliermondii ATCC 6260]
MSTTVFVSGANGFIAQHIIKQLLEKNYKVIGSVRSQQKGEDLIKNFKSSNLSYEIIESLSKEGAFDKALENHPEVEVFLHTASPATFATEDLKNDLLLPAIDGTKNVLKSIKAHGKNVKKVVVTSSIVSIAKVTRGPTGTINEKEWNDITWDEGLQNGLTAYVASKTFAEKAAWEFVETNKPSWTLTTVNPVFVFGPQAFDSSVKGGMNLTSEILLSSLRLKPEDPLPETDGYFADVRDVARAHIAAFESPDAAGQRLLVNSEEFNFRKILDIINKKFPQLNVVKGSSEKVKLPYVLDSSASRKIIGDKFIDLETSVYDCVKQYVDNN